MDSSPKNGSVPLREISLRLVEGLQTSAIFPESNYLDNIKAELKKLMKQRYAYRYMFKTCTGNRSGHVCYIRFDKGGNFVHMIFKESF